MPQLPKNISTNSFNSWLTISQSHTHTVDLGEKQIPKPINLEAIVTVHK